MQLNDPQIPNFSPLSRASRLAHSYELCIENYVAEYFCSTTDILSNFNFSRNQLFSVFTVRMLVSVT
jgi:hypothetical protein